MTVPSHDHDPDINAASAIAADGAVSLVPPATQREAAELTQQIFAQAFRDAATPDKAAPADVHLTRCRRWVADGSTADARGLRLALLLSGLDQWGLAFSRAFGIAAIPRLTRLISDLRTALTPAQEARLLRQFDRLDRTEGDAIDFKISVRREIHLALWHAMSAGDNMEAVTPILETLGGLLVSLDRQMPTLGWRLVADALAHMQIRLLDPHASALAQSGTQALLEALSRAWPRPHYEEVMALSAQALLAWQQRRSMH